MINIVFDFQQASRHASKANSGVYLEPSVLMTRDAQHSCRRLQFVDRDQLTTPCLFLCRFNDFVRAGRTTVVYNGKVTCECELNVNRNLLPFLQQMTYSVHKFPAISMLQYKD